MAHPILAGDGTLQDVPLGTTLPLKGPRTFRTSSGPWRALTRVRTRRPWPVTAATRDPRPASNELVISLGMGRVCQRGRWLFLTKPVRSGPRGERSKRVGTAMAM